MVKITALPVLATPSVDGTETLPVVKNARTFQTPATPLIAALAEPSVRAAQIAAATAEAAAGPTYLSIAAGLAATASGASFAVNNGDGTVSVYLNSAGSAVLQRTLATTDYLRSAAGLSGIGARDGGTAQEAIDLLGKALTTAFADKVMAALSMVSASDAAMIRRSLMAAPDDALRACLLNINGNCRISQERGSTAVTEIDSEKWVLDGHKVWVAGNARVKAQQVTITDLPGFSHALRIETTTADTTGASTIRHVSIGSDDRFLPLAWGTRQARDVMWYAWVKTSAAGVYPISFLNGDRTAAASVVSVTIDAPNVWQLVKVRVPAQLTTSRWDVNGLGYRCELMVAGPVASNIASDVGHYFMITGEAVLAADYDCGLSTTAALMPSLADNLRACQRYYQTSYNLDVVPGAITGAGAPLAITQAASTYCTLAQIRLPDAMVRVPSVTLYSPSTGATGKAYDANSAADITIQAQNTGQSGFTAYTNNVAVAGAHSLSFHYVLDARIG